jgi:hypothetical protein
MHVLVQGQLCESHICCPHCNQQKRYCQKAACAAASAVLSPEQPDRHAAPLLLLNYNYNMFSSLCDA